MTSAFHIRPFWPGDSPRLHEILTAAVRNIPGTAYTPRMKDLWVNHPLGPNRFETYVKTGKTFLLAETPDGTVVGFVAWGGNTLRMLYVLPEVQGQGLGSLLLQKALAQAEAADSPILEVNAALNAEGFYARYGFHREVEANPPPANIPHVYMVKDED